MGVARAQTAFVEEQVKQEVQAAVEATLAVRHVTLSVALARVTVAQEPAAGAPRRWLPSRPRRADISRGRPDNPAPGKVTSQSPAFAAFKFTARHTAGK